MLFRQFFNLTKYVKIVGKLLDQHFNILLFSNPGEKFLLLVESRGQIFPVVVLLFRTFSPGLENHDALKCWSDNFPTTLTYVVKLENCQNKISMYGCSTIKGKRFK